MASKRKKWEKKGPQTTKLMTGKEATCWQGGECVGCGGGVAWLMNSFIRIAFPVRFSFPFALLPFCPSPRSLKCQQIKLNWGTKICCLLLWAIEQLPREGRWQEGGRRGELPQILLIWLNVWCNSGQLLTGPAGLVSAFLLWSEGWFSQKDSFFKKDVFFGELDHLLLDFFH